MQLDATHPDVGDAWVGVGDLEPDGRPQVGDHISVWLTAEMLDSDPPHVEATCVVVDSPNA